MKQSKIFFFVSGGLVACLVAIHLLGTRNNTQNMYNSIPTTSYGAFLAAQHALYTNNFDKAGEFLQQIDDSAKGYKSVDEIRILTDFLNGTIPADTKTLNKQKTIVSRILVDANLIQNDKWNDVYNRHKTDNIRMTAPFRIWSGIAINHITVTLKFIDTLDTNPSWQSFLRGQIYAEQGKIQKATEAFEAVLPEFLNINDYLYLMSFYKHNNLEKQANALRTKFTTKPGSMFMINYTDVPDWSLFSGYKNQLAFNLVQTVAHTQSLTHSDLSLLLLHFAKNIAQDNKIQNDAINYHSGLYMLKNNGNYNKYFSKIDESSPYYPFVNLRLAELNNDEQAIKRAIDTQPLFMPAVKKFVDCKVQKGDRRTALHTIDKSLGNKNISTGAQAYLYKIRADVNLIFGGLDASQKDLNYAKALLSTPDPDIYNTQARIWAVRGEDLDKAYMYALQLVRFAPMNACAWDTLGRVIHAREGVDAALDIVERVGEFASSCSSLFEHMGDMYVEIGETKLAHDAYLRAIELSEDGLTIKSVLEKKLKKAE